MTNETPNDILKRLTAETRGKRTSKYGNKPIQRDGIRYDSQAEYAYKGILDLQVKAGEITGYDHHIPIPLIAGNGFIVGVYEADYIAYLPSGKRIIYDVKSPATTTGLFRWKAKHLKAQYGDEIIIIDSKTLKPISK